MSQDVDLLRCGADVAETSSVGVWVDIMVSTKRENNLQKRTKRPLKLFYIKVAGYHMTSHPILHPFSIPLLSQRTEFRITKTLLRFPEFVTADLWGFRIPNPELAHLLVSAAPSMIGSQGRDLCSASRGTSDPITEDSNAP